MGRTSVIYEDGPVKDPRNELTVFDQGGFDQPQICRLAISSYLVAEKTWFSCKMSRNDGKIRALEERKRINELKEAEKLQKKMDSIKARKVLLQIGKALAERTTA